MKMPRPTKNAEQGTAGQGRAIVPTAASSSKTPRTLLVLLRDTINNALLRAWCAAPSAWSRGTILPKPKGLVLENTTTSSGCNPHREAGFCHAQIPGMVRLHSPAMVSGGMGHTARLAARLLACFQHPVHPLRLKTQTVALVSPAGAKTMTATNVASASTRTPITLPTTGNHTSLDTSTSEAQAFALLQATSDATMAKLYLSRGNIPAARRKVVRLLKALQVLEVSQ